MLVITSSELLNIEELIDVEVQYPKLSLREAAASPDEIIVWGKSSFIRFDKKGHILEPLFIGDDGIIDIVEKFNTRAADLLREIIEFEGLPYFEYSESE